VIVVDWYVLKADESLHLLRAALPVGGRALPVCTGKSRLGQAAVHTAFLAQLRRLLPVDSQPIVVTDAGFRMPSKTASGSLLRKLRVSATSCLLRALAQSATQSINRV
jgi:hypothetical protein